jgi:hypothetical protein
VFQCYLDDSGTSGLPVVTLGGFFGAMRHWETLEPKLDAILKPQGIEVLHAKQFHDSDPPFKGWSRIRKRSFVDELFTPAHGLIGGFTMTARRNISVAMRDKFPNHSPIGLAFGITVMQLATNKVYGPLIKRDGLSFLVESGNANNAEIEGYFHFMSKQPALEGGLRSISFIAKDSCRAIQLADFLAFHSRRLMRDNDRFSGKLALPDSPILQIIKRHCPVVQRSVHGIGKKVANIKKIGDLDSLMKLAHQRP